MKKEVKEKENIFCEACEDKFMSGGGYCRSNITELLRREYDGTISHDTVEEAYNNQDFTDMMRFSANYYDANEFYNAFAN